MFGRKHSSRLNAKAFEWTNGFSLTCMNGSGWDGLASQSRFSYIYIYIKKKHLEFTVWFPVYIEFSSVTGVIACCMFDTVASPLLCYKFNLKMSFFKSKSESIISKSIQTIYAALFSKLRRSSFGRNHSIVSSWVKSLQALHTSPVLPVRSSPAPLDWTGSVWTVSPQMFNGVKVRVVLAECWEINRCPCPRSHSFWSSFSSKTRVWLHLSPPRFCPVSLSPLWKISASCLTIWMVLAKWWAGPGVRQTKYLQSCQNG